MSMFRTLPAALCLAVLAATGCRHSTPPPASSAAHTGTSGTGQAASQSDGIRFEDVAEKAGIQYVYPKQPRPMRNLEAFGCGCAAFDFDDDGWMDILLVSRPHPILYHNRKNGTFEDVTAASGLDRLDGDWKGCAIGDYDNDGRLDIVLTGYHCLALMRNMDGRRFQDVTRQAGLDPANRNHWGSSAGFMDLDGTGRLALVILNYVVFGPKEPQYCELLPGVRTGCPPATYKPEFAEIWEGRGDGTFREISAKAGISSTHGRALVVAFCDVDGNGKPDIYIGNDGTAAELLLNRGNMQFVNAGRSSGVAVGQSGSPVAAMGVDWGDFDCDGRMDLAVSAFSNEPYEVMRNLGGSVFEHSENVVGIAGPTLKPLGFGTKWVDFDNDGWLDLTFANGHVYDASGRIDPQTPFYEPIMLFHNVADRYETSARSFVDIVGAMGAAVSRPMLGRGLATADFDNDGRTDILVVDYEGPPMLLHNASETHNHWITLDLRTDGANRFGYGATVVVRSGPMRWVSFVSPASSYLSSSDPRLHFGLGAVSRLDTVTVRWSDGSMETRRNVPVDRIIRITRH